MPELDLPVTKPRRPSKRGNPIAAARVTPDVYDQLYALSRLLRVDISVLIREAIAARIKAGC